MEGQDSEFDPERMPVLPGLSSRHPAGDSQIAEPRGPRREQGAFLMSGSRQTEDGQRGRTFAVCRK